MSIYNIGRIGIDVAKINIPVESHEVASLMTHIRQQNINGRPGIKVTDTKCTIVIDGVHAVIVQFTRSGTPSLRVVIHASQDGNNLLNMTISELINKYDYIAAKLQYMYGISSFVERRTYAKITYLELNRTFTSDFAYIQFYRTVSLLGSAIGGTKFEISKAYNKDVFAAETTIFSRSKYKVRIYNKSLEMVENKVCYDYNKELIRVELVYEKEQPILTDLKNNMLFNINQQMLENAYKKRFSNWRKDVDKFLSSKMLYKPNLNQSKLTAANIVASHCRCGQIKDHGLILADIIAQEDTYKVPILLDGRDLVHIIMHLQDIGILSMDVSAMDHFNGFMPVYQSSIVAAKTFTRQRAIYNDFFAHLIQEWDGDVSLVY